MSKIDSFFSCLLLNRLFFQGAQGVPGLVHLWACLLECWDIIGVCWPRFLRSMWCSAMGTFGYIQLSAKYKAVTVNLYVSYPYVTPEWPLCCSCVTTVLLLYVPTLYNPCVILMSPCVPPVWLLHHPASPCVTSMTPAWPLYYYPASEMLSRAREIPCGVMTCGASILERFIQIPPWPK